MSANIHPNRLEVSDRFPMLGFTLRTDGSPQRAEVAIATDPSLFRSEHKTQRTAANFYSSRAAKPLLVPRGEAVYLVPPEVLARFIGKERIYFSLATTPERAGAATRIDVMATEASPYISLKGLTGRSLRRVRLLPGRQDRSAEYGVTAGAGLEWAGDAAVPGAERVGGNGGGKKPEGSAQPEAGAGVAAAAATLDYDDGFGLLPPLAPAAPPVQPQPLADYEPGASSSDEAAQHGIEGPIPDPAPDTPQSLGFGRALEEQPEYPQADRFAPAAPENHSRKAAQRTINRIVIHITDGGANINGPISWFQNPTAQVSAHYIVGQDGEVVQMVRHNDVAWHASRANGDSIGIEHVANTRGLNPTEIEYVSSAALVRWLCDSYAIPADRQHILGHCEADTGTSHKGCPNAVWDWGYYLDLVNPQQDSQAEGDAATLGLAGERQLQESGRSAFAAPGLGEEFSVFWHDVQYQPQSSQNSCWAAAAAMVAGWYNRQSIADTEIAEMIPVLDAYLNGLWPEERQVLADVWGLVAEPPASYGIGEFRSILTDYGPLWVDMLPTPAGGGHVRVVIGMESDGNPDGSGTTMYLFDPWPGTAGKIKMSFPEFVALYEGRTGTSGPYIRMQILHAPDSAGHTMVAAAPFSLTVSAEQARSAAGRLRLATPPPPRPRALLAAEVAVAIGGVVLDRTVNNEGDVSWELDQFRGLKHPKDQAPPDPAPFKDASTIVLEGWPKAGGLVDDIYADFTIDWQYNGLSLGNVRIENKRVNDAIGWALRVQARIMDDATLHQPNGCAGLRVSFHYRFTRAIGSEVIAITELRLFGDGSYEQSSRWEQAEALQYSAAQA